MASTEGGFHFDSLPVGDYRMLGSFDVNEIDEDLIEQSNASTVHVDVSQIATIELSLWTAP
jgi:hypothetical protein